MHFKNWSWCVGILVLTCGCAPDLVPALKAKAASDFACPDAQLANKGIDRYLDRVDGCNKENMYAYDHSAEQWVSPLDRAPFELSCDRASLSTKVLGTNTVGIEGCGKKATYVLTMRGWVMNTAAE
jgi:hypothetical protein